MTTFSINDQRVQKDGWGKPRVFVTEPMSTHELTEWLNDFMSQPHVWMIAFGTEYVQGGMLLGKVFATLVYQERSGMPVPIAGDEEDGY
jgi:hypothetical protein